MKNRIWAIALLLLPLAAVAQHDDFIGRSDILLSGGGMNYIGDLNNQSVFGRVHPAFSGGLRYRLDKRWALRGEVAYGALSGGNPDCIERRNLSFRTDLFEGVLLGEFSFWPYGFGSTDHNWTLYMFGGVGVFHFNPMAKYSVGEGMEEWAALQPLHTEGQGTLEYPDRRPYKLTEVCFPFGMGAKFLIGKTVSLSVVLYIAFALVFSTEEERRLEKENRLYRRCEQDVCGRRPAAGECGEWRVGRDLGGPQRRGGAGLCQRTRYQAGRRFA